MDKKPLIVLIAMLVMDAIGILNMAKLVPTDYRLDEWAAAIVLIIGSALAIFGYPLAGKKKDGGE